MRIIVQRAMLAALTTLGCADGSRVEPFQPGDSRLGVWAPDSGATLLRTTQSELADPTLAVVGDAATWSDLWTRTWPRTQPVPDLPAIDFVLTSVVVVGLGRRAGPGYTVVVDSIVVRTNGAEAFATETQPGAGCGGGSGSTAPVHMVRAIGHPPVIMWTVRTIRRDCGVPAMRRIRL